MCCFGSTLSFQQTRRSPATILDAGICPIVFLYDPSERNIRQAIPLWPYKMDSGT